MKIKLPRVPFINGNDFLTANFFIFSFLNPDLQVADVDPKSLCDFNPCEEAGCLHDPAARCITNFECNPVFFNVDGNMLSNCKGVLRLDQLFHNLPHTSLHCRKQ